MLVPSSGRVRVQAARVADLAAVDGRPPVELARWDGAPPELATEARLAHDGRSLAVAFRCRHDGIDVDPALPRDRPAPRLWERDVVEVFVSDRAGGVPYRELEASPAGQWLALAFDAPRRPAAAPWETVPRVEAWAGPDLFEVRLVVPLAALRTGDGTGPARWRIGLYRIAGARAPGEPRRHLALPPCGGPEPDFHRPATWADLDLEGPAA